MLNSRLVLVLLLLASSTALGSNHLLAQLHSDNGWEMVSTTDDGLTLRSKSLPGYELQALEISSETDLTPESIVQVVENVASYNEIITSNKAMECSLIGMKNGNIYGYQYYKVPLMKNRYVVFEMRPAYSSVDGHIRSDWVLLNEEQLARLELPPVHKDRSPVLIDEGAGTWIFRPVADGQFQVSYRLYMNPGGWIPDFILENVNRKGIAGLFEDVLREAAKGNIENSVISEVRP